MKIHRLYPILERVLLCMSCLLKMPCEKEIGGFLGKVTLAHTYVNSGKGKEKIRSPV